MRYVSFEVPTAVLPDFVKEMEERDLQAIITGLNDDNEIVLKVAYEREQVEDVNELEDLFDDLIENLPEEDEDERQ